MPKQELNQLSQSYHAQSQMQDLSFNLFSNPSKEEILSVLQKLPEETLKFVYEQGFLALYKSKLTPEAGGEKEIEPPISDEELEKPLPPMDWIIKNVMPRETIGLLIADGGVGKSFFLLNLGVWLSVGLEEAPLKPPKPLKVLYLNSEDSRNILIQRLKRLKEHYTKVWHLRKDRFFVIPFGKDVKPLAQYDYSGNPQKGKGLELLENLILKYKPDVVFLDTLTRFYGLNENIANDASYWINLLEKLAQTYKISFLIAHHIRKSASTGIEKFSSRGSSAFVDNVRLALALERPEPQLLKLSFIKANYAPLKPPIFFKDQNGVYLPIDELQIIVEVLPEAFQEVDGKATCRELIRKKKFKTFRDALSELTGLPFAQLKPHLPEALEKASREGLIERYERREGKGRPAIYYACKENWEEETTDVSF